MIDAAAQNRCYDRNTQSLSRLLRRRESFERRTVPCAATLLKDGQNRLQYPRFVFQFLNQLCRYLFGAAAQQLSLFQTLRRIDPFHKNRRRQV